MEQKYKKRQKNKKIQKFKKTLVNFENVCYNNNVLLYE